MRKLLTMSAALAVLLLSVETASAADHEVEYSAADSLDRVFIEEIAYLAEHSDGAHVDEHSSGDKAKHKASNEAIRADFVLAYGQCYERELVNPNSPNRFRTDQGVAAMCTPAILAAYNMKFTCDGHVISAIIRLDDC